MQRTKFRCVEPSVSCAVVCLDRLCAVIVLESFPPSLPAEIQLQAQFRGTPPEIDAWHVQRCDEFPSQLLDVRLRILGNIMADTCDSDFRF